MIDSQKKEDFYQYFECIKDEFGEELRSLVEDDDKSELFELCTFYSKIGLNAPKIVDENTCEVKASFQFSDINLAVERTVDFILVHGIKDVGEFMNFIRRMHCFATDDSVSTTALIKSKDYNYSGGFFGRYINFAQLPDDIFDQIKDRIIKETKGL